MALLQEQPPRPIPDDHRKCAMQSALSVNLKLLARADLAIAIVNENDMALSFRHANLLDQGGFAKGPAGPEWVYPWHPARTGPFDVALANRRDVCSQQSRRADGIRITLPSHTAHSPSS